MTDRILMGFRTRRGLAALVIALLLTVVGVAGAGAAAILLLPLWIGIGWVAAWIWEPISECRPGPKPSPFTRRQSSSGMRTMLRQDHNAHFLMDSRGFLFRKRFWFEATGCPPVRIPAQKFDQFNRAQAQDPVLVTIASDRRYWWWEGGFYWEADNARSVVQPRCCSTTTSSPRVSAERIPPKISGSCVPNATV